MPSHSERKCPACGDVENFDGEWCRECGHIEGPTVLIAPAPTRTVWVCRCPGHQWDEKPRHVICAQCQGAIREVEVVVE